LLSKTASGGHNRKGTQVLHVDGPTGSDYTGGSIRSLSKTPSSKGHNGERMRVSCGVQSSGVDKEVYELPAIESLDIKTACIQGVAAVPNPGVHGSRSSDSGGNHLDSPDTLFIGKGQSGSHRGVDVSGTDQLFLSSLSERDGPDHPLSIKSYRTLRQSIHIMLVTTESGVQGPAPLLTIPFLHPLRAIPILLRRGKHAWKYYHVFL